jgi:hypothetical protein
MPNCSATGSTSASIPRTNNEYGGCSVMKRSRSAPRPRFSAGRNGALRPARPQRPSAAVEAERIGPPPSVPDRGEERTARLHSERDTSGGSVDICADSRRLAWGVVVASGGRAASRGGSSGHHIDAARSERRR